MLAYIYTLSDPRTNEIRYIGKTNNLHQRMKEHIKMWGCDKQRCKLDNWKLGLKNNNLCPIFEVLDEVLVEELDYWEKYWISQMKTWGFKLLNMTEGGDGLINPSEETRRKIGEKSKGRIPSEETRTKISKSNYNKGSILIVYNDQGEYINEYPNSYRAGEALGINYKDISKIINGKMYFIHKFTFFKKAQEKEIPELLQHRINHKYTYDVVLSFNDLGVIINKYKNISEAARCLNINFRNIHAVLNKHRDKAAGLFWIYEFEYDKNPTIINVIISNYKEKRLIAGGKPVFIFDINTNDVKKFNKLKEAASFLNIKSPQIIHTIKRKKIYKHYRISYENKF